ncbi:MAG: DNA gyrase inhibitor YacG [Planctomycetales bacterium]|nr:DNA gyrase inhibitor YacG [Planctomycetales bacterium]
MRPHDPFRPRCPTCDMLVLSEESQQFLPFCSQRCRLIDLGRWLNEEHTLSCEVLEEDNENGNAPSVGTPLPPGWHDA